MVSPVRSRVARFRRWLVTVAHPLRKNRSSSSSFLRPRTPGRERPSAPSSYSGGSETKLHNHVRRGLTTISRRPVERTIFLSSEIGFGGVRRARTSLPGLLIVSQTHTRTRRPVSHPSGRADMAVVRPTVFVLALLFLLNARPGGVSGQGNREPFIFPFYIPAYVCVCVCV